MKWTKVTILTIFAVIVLGISIISVTFSYFINKCGEGEKILVVDNNASSLSYNMDSPVYVRLK